MDDNVFPQLSWAWERWRAVPTLVGAIWWLNGTKKSQGISQPLFVWWWMFPSFSEQTSSPPSPLPPSPPQKGKICNNVTSPENLSFSAHVIIIFRIRQTQIFFRIIEISQTNSRSRFSIVIRTISLIPNSLPVGTHASEEAPFVKTSVYTDRTSKYRALHDLSGPIQKGPVAFRGHQTPLGEKRRSVVKARFYIKARNEYLRIRFLPLAGSLQII